MKSARSLFAAALLLCALAAVLRPAPAAATSLDDFTTCVNTYIVKNGRGRITGPVLNNCLQGAIKAIGAASDASSLTSGTIDPARLPAIASSAAGLTSGFLDPARLPASGINASAITLGTLGPARLPAFNGDCVSVSGTATLSCPAAASASGLGINVTRPDIGMQAGGFDNSTKLQALLDAVQPAAGGLSSGTKVTFPAAPGQAQTPFYFGSPVSWSRGGVVDCGNTPPRAVNVAMVFAPGIDGFVNENYATSNDGSGGTVETLGCAFISLGMGMATGTAGSNVVSNASMSGWGGVPAPTWGAGDGIIVYQQYAPRRNIVGFVTGSTLTLNSTNYNLDMGSTILSPNSCILPNTIIQSQTSGDGTGGVGTYSLSQPSNCDVGSAGTPVTIYAYPMAVAPVTPPGTTVTSVTGQTLALSNAITNTNSYKTLVTFDLPAQQAYQATTTAGATCMTITAGPTAQPNRRIHSGDKLWTRAFPWLATVATASEPYLAPATPTNPDGSTQQTVCVAAATMVANLTASMSATNLPVWVVPGGRKFRSTGTSTKSYIYGFPFGIDMSCQSTGTANCTTSTVKETTAEFTIFNYYIAGDNTGGSTFTGNRGAYALVADLVDDGRIASNHIGFNSNCMEESKCPYGVLTDGVYTNNASFIDGYIGGYQVLSNLGTSGAAAQAQANGHAHLYITNSGGYPGDGVTLDGTGMRGPRQFTGYLGANGPCTGWNQDQMIGTANNMLFLSYNCTVGSGEVFGYDKNDGDYKMYGYASTAYATWGISGPLSTGYGGFGSPFPMFLLPRGFLMGPSATRRVFDYGSAAQPATNDMQGNFRQNLTPVAGGPGAFVALNNGVAGVGTNYIPLDGSDAYAGGEQIAAGGSGPEHTVAITGAALGDFIADSFSGDLAGCSINKRVSAANTVKYSMRCISATTPPAGTVYFRLQHHS